MSEFVAVEEPVVVPQRRKSKNRRNDSQPRKQPPYAVIVHDDNAHTFPYVTELLQRVCGHDRTKAYLLTCEIHFNGRAAVWTGPLEVAELKRDQIRGYGPDFHARRPVKFPLGVTVEPLSGE